MAAFNPSTVVIAALVPLFIWRAWSRFRRMVGRQRLTRYRPWIQLTIFPLLIAVLAFSVREEPARLVWLALGLAAGLPLAAFGLRRTAFEASKEGLYYTPNAHLGIALSSLFVLRIAYRIVEIVVFGVPSDLGHFTSSALTLATFGLLAGYYTGYAVGLVRWRRRVLEKRRRRMDQE